MHGVTIEEFVPWLLVWIVAFASSVARSVRDDDYRSFGHCFALGCTSGFLAFGCCAVYVWFSPGTPPNSLFFVGFAAIFGTLGKEQDKFAGRLLRKITRGVMAAKEEGEEKEDAKQDK